MQSAQKLTKQTGMQTSPMRKKDSNSHYSGANKTPGRDSTLNPKSFFPESKRQQKSNKQKTSPFAEVTSLAALWAEIKEYFDKPNSTEPTKNEIITVYPPKQGDKTTPQSNNKNAHGEKINRRKRYE